MAENGRKLEVATVILPSLIRCTCTFTRTSRCDSDID